jgi:hypothetical protein
MTPVEASRPRQLVPCCLSISSTAQPADAAAETLKRQWRALSVSGDRELGIGSFETNACDPLAIVRDKAMEHVRSQGYEPQQFVLERDAAC